MDIQHVDGRENRQRITRLVVAPHAYDEVLGCGGLLAKYRDESAVVLLAEHDEDDEDTAREFKSAQQTLGHTASFQFGLPFGRIGRDMHRLVAMLGDLLNQIRPVELYVPYPSFDQDRVAAFEAGMRLARSSLRQNQWVPPTVLMYGLPRGATPHYSSDVDWRVCEPLDEDELDRKIAAALAYNSRLSSEAETIQSIRTFAKMDSTSGETRWGERFAVIRSVIGFDFESAPASRPASVGTFV